MLQNVRTPPRFHAVAQDLQQSADVAGTAGRGRRLGRLIITLQVGGGVPYMTDSSHASRRDPVAPDDEAGLEEARLRQQAIGVKLRHMFDQVVNEPVPDEFLDILRRADARASQGDQS